MEKAKLNFAYGTNELPELRPLQNVWKQQADASEFYDIAGFHGIPELQQSIQQRFEARGVKGELSPRQVMVTSGGTEALFTSLMWLRSIGGRVILQHPSWGYFADTLQLLDIPFTYSFSTQTEGLEKELREVETTGPLLFLLTHPSNPFSFIFSDNYLKTLSRWVASRETHFVLSDEIYDWYVGPSDDYLSWSTIHGLKQSIIVHGYSKATGLAGFRIGYLVADPAIYKGLFPFHYSNSYGAAIFSQYIALAAQKDELKVRGLLKEALDERWEILFHTWKNSDSLSVRPRRPGMYAYIDMHAPLKEQKRFVSGLKSRFSVWINPGWNFGTLEGGFRLNLCRPKANLKEGVRRIQIHAKQHFS
jgi:aspartate/methionine/tyrosine aminotransferase